MDCSNTMYRQGGRVGRRRLFLIITIAEHLALRIPGIYETLFKRELTRIVRSQDEMNRLIDTLGPPNFPGELEDRFFQTVFYHLNENGPLGPTPHPKWSPKMYPKCAPKMQSKWVPKMCPKWAAKMLYN